MISRRASFWSCMMSSGLFSFTACSTSRICRFISGFVTFGWMPAPANQPNNINKIK